MTDDKDDDKGDLNADYTNPDGSVRVPPTPEVGGVAG